MVKPEQPVTPQEQNPPAVSTRAQRTRRWLGLLLTLYVSLLSVISLCNALGPERWWWSSFNLYLPQWLWGVPGVVLLPITWRVAKRWTWLPLLPLLWVAGPIMGLNWQIGASEPEGGGPRLRIMTYNVKYGRRGVGPLMREIRQMQPDVLLLQDCREALRQALKEELPSWNVRVSDQYVITSRFPLSEAAVGSLSFPGESETYLHCRMQWNGTSVALYNVHLLTPREGLTALRHRDSEGVGLIQKNAANRLYQAARLAEDVRRETGTALLAGDLNAPVQSLVCRKLFEAGLRDAFSTAGRGYGYTYGHTLRLGISSMRIDHILTDARWHVLRCWTGGGEGSDHRPVIADITLRRN